MRPYAVGMVLAMATAAGHGVAQTKLLVTVVEQKTARPVTDLKAEEFVVMDAEAPRKVLAASYGSAPIDVMLLVDSSLVGQAVQGAAADLIGQLQEKEQMALVAYHSSADMVQDFTSSKEALLRSLKEMRFGNLPRALDGIYAAADSGFEHATFRKVILLLTTGYEGDSRVTEREVTQLCRKRGISIYVLYLTGRERGLFENLARRTGGAAMNMREVARATKEPAARVFEVMRNSYSLTISGNLPVSEKLKITITRPTKVTAGGLQVD